jgi:DNA-binding GntR family transcriptional regulator
LSKDGGYNVYDIHIFPEFTFLIDEALMSDNFEIPSDYRTIQQLVTDRIRNAILDGKFRPNERLNQAGLAEKLNVSRIPTREALRTLEGEGLVKFYPHRGAVVSTMSPDEIEEVYEIRIMLELNAAQRALKVMNEEQLQEIRRIQARMTHTPELDAWVNLNDELHRAIYKPSGWTRLISVIEMLRNLTTPYVRMYVADEFDRDAANMEHAEIVAALESRDSVGLKAVLRRHLAHSCQGILSYLKRVDQESSLSEVEEISTS